MLDNLRDREDLAVETGDFIILREEDVRVRTTAPFGFIVKTSVRVHGEQHKLIII